MGILILNSQYKEDANDRQCFLKDFHNIDYHSYEIECIPVVAYDNHKLTRVENKPNTETSDSELIENSQIWKLASHYDDSDLESWFIISNLFVDHR